MNPRTTTPGSSDTEELFFFGEDDALFGCLHPPSGGVTRDVGLITCYPLGPEYNRTHRAFRQLAIRLARAGFPVLRFDLFGTGDSKGTAEEAWIPRWIEDLSRADDELRRRSGVTRIGLIGLRLGGSLAAVVASRLQNVDALVLWDPIVEGDQYLQQLRALDAEPAWGVGDPLGAEELQGLPMDAERERQLAEIDLAAFHSSPAGRTLVVQTGDDPLPAALAERWSDEAAKLTLARIPGPAIWKDEEGALLPMEVLQRIAAWFEDVGR